MVAPLALLQGTPSSLRLVAWLLVASLVAAVCPASGHADAAMDRTAPRIGMAHHGHTGHGVAGCRSASCCGVTRQAAKKLTEVPVVLTARVTATPPPPRPRVRVQDRRGELLPPPALGSALPLIC